jgi:hypothetical protein
MRKTHTKVKFSIFSHFPSSTRLVVVVYRRQTNFVFQLAQNDDASIAKMAALSVLVVKAWDPTKRRMVKLRMFVVGCKAKRLCTSTYAKYIFSF